MTTPLDTLTAMVEHTVATAIGRVHREDPVTPKTGGSAGNARLTAWIGLVLLVLLVVECATLLSLHSFISVHIFLGAFLVPLVLLKTATTGWRMLRYYTRSGGYVAAGPPPFLLRVLGPLVVLGALAVLGTGLSLIALGDSSRSTLFSIVGFQVNAIALHKAAFLLWLGTTGLHVLGRFIPALHISRLMPADVDVPQRVPGATLRLLVSALTVATAVATGAIVLSLAGSWSSRPWY